MFRENIMPHRFVSSFFSIIESGEASLLTGVMEQIYGLGFGINLQNEFGETALIVAAKFGHLAVAEFFLENGADVRIASNNGYAAIHYAVENNHLAVVSALLEKDCEIVNDTSDQLNQWTPLHFAASNDNFEIAQKLILKGADIDRETKLGYKALALTNDEGVRTLLRSQQSSFGVRRVYSAGRLDDLSKELTNGARANLGHRSV